MLVPSFTLSELTRAFQIGFIIYMVFVVVDLIVATILLALGMSMISPTTISLPFKLLLFVMLDGWARADPRPRAVVPLRAPYISREAAGAASAAHPEGWSARTCHPARSRRIHPCRPVAPRARASARVDSAAPLRAAQNDRLGSLHVQRPHDQDGQERDGDRVNVLRPRHADAERKPDARHADRIEQLAAE